MKPKVHPAALLFILSGIGAAAVVLLSTSRFGPGVTVDGVNYISTAKNLALGRGYFTFFEEPFISWAPFLPTLMAAGTFIGLEPAVLVRYLNAAVLGLIAFTCGWIVLKESRSIIFSFLASSLIVVAHPLIAVSKMVYTEPLFILLSLWFLLKAEKLLEEPTLKQILGLGGLVSLAWMTRYVGATLVMTALVLLVLNRRLSIFERMRAFIVFLSVAALPVALWLVRNYGVSGTLTGRVERPFIWSHVFETIRFSGNIFAWWYFPGPFSQPWPYLLLFGLIIGGMILIALSWLYTKGRISYSPKIFVFAIFTLIYTAAVMININLYAIDFSNVIGFFASVPRLNWEAMETLGSRYLTPIYLPILMILFIWAAQISVSKGAGGPARRRLTGKIIFAVFILLLGVEIYINLRVTGASVRTWVRQGSGGYNTVRWRMSETMAYLDTLPPGTEVISNVPDAIYLIAERHAGMSPRKTDYYNTRKLLAADLKKLREKLLDEKKTVFLVWFNSHFRTHVCVPRELGRYFKLQPVRRLGDGRIYQVLPLPAT